MEPDRPLGVSTRDDVPEPSHVPAQLEKRPATLLRLFLAGDADGDVQFANVVASEGAIAATAINTGLQREDSVQDLWKLSKVAHQDRSGRPWPEILARVQQRVRITQLGDDLLGVASVLLSPSKVSLPQGLKTFITSRSFFSEAGQIFHLHVFPSTLSRFAAFSPETNGRAGKWGLMRKRTENAAAGRLLHAA